MEDATPQVSVICSVRNGARTLESVIESILNQTVSAWELIIVDDGSKDGSQEIALQYAKQDDRIRFFPTEGIGRGAALNLALSHARAEFVANIDADDPSHPRRLEIQTKALQLNPEFALLGTDSVIVYDFDSPIWPEDIEGQNFSIRDVTKALVFGNPLNHSSVIMRRSTLEIVGGYSLDRRSQFDYELWVKLAEAGFRLGKIDQRLASKRIHRGQSFENKDRFRYLLSSAEVQARAIRSLRGGLGAWAGLTGRICWGILPSKIRRYARPFLAK